MIDPQLKAALVPYAYSLSREAYDAGVPPVRALLLEFAHDERAYLADEPGAAYSFLFGPSLLVAPVFDANASRAGIYLPAEADDAGADADDAETAAAVWSDWWNGTVYAADGATLPPYATPLEAARRG